MSFVAVSERNRIHESQRIASLRLEALAELRDDYEARTGCWTFREPQSHAALDRVQDR